MLEQKNLKNQEVPSENDYTTSLEEVIAKEAEYLDNRRLKVKLPKADNPSKETLIGISISGGGVRSATLGLGMLQSFIKSGIFRFFDYMSTVSGGGYIGATLSSIMSKEPDYEDAEGLVKIRNKKYDVADIGLSADTSPFVNLNAHDGYRTAAHTRMGVRHQLHHLRTHGEYLTPNKSVFSWEVMRAVGSLLAGVWYNIVILSLILIMFVSFHLGFFHLISEGVFIPVVKDETIVLKQNDINPNVKSRDLTEEYLKPFESILDILNWYKENESFTNQLVEIWNSLWSNYDFAFLFFTIGVTVGFVFVFLVDKLPNQVARSEFEEKQADRTSSIDIHYRRNSGDNIQRYVTSNFKKKFLFASFALGPILGYLAIFLVMGIIQNVNYWLMFTLPFCFSFGLFSVIYGAIPMIELANYEHSHGRLFRSLHTGMQGASFYGVFLSALMPVIIIFLFSASISFDILLSIFSGGFAYFFLMSQFFGSEGKSFLSRIMRRIRNPLLNVFTVLFVIFLLSTTSHIIFQVNSGLNPVFWFRGGVYEINYFAVLLFFSALSLFLFIGHTANINKLSFHYFYRDRLSEAYLRTDARVKRPDSEQAILYQGMPLINLRNHVGLKLKDLGEGNGKAPYHLINAALNLQGTNDLVKKTMKSDHFLFSKYYVGSESTGYIKTDKYRRGYTRLAVAMTISAAAVSSAMGNMSFAAQNFFMTLFNLRTGYWIQNPWYENLKRLKLLKRSHTKRLYRWLISAITPYRTFWPIYTVRELMGLTNARSPRIYVSDGGHTGDNLGLLPLLARRCKLIVVCDFEEDKNYTFRSFNHALRVAHIKYNIEVDIDLEKMAPSPSDKDKIPLCNSCVAKGIIHYNDEAKTKGVLVYLKSSISRDKNGKIPVTVYNYLKSNPSFPHQSTIDQYFDDEQFEAYRVLGNHIANQATEMIEVELRKYFSIKSHQDL